MKNFKRSPGPGVSGILLVSLISFTLSSCLKDNNNYQPVATALLMVTQGSPDAPAENLFLTPNRVNAEAFEYGDHLGYFSAYTGNRSLVLNNYTSNAQIVADTLHLNTNTTYSLFLANTAAKPDLILLTDTISVPASGKASIRFVDVSPDAGAVDLAAGNAVKLVTNKTYKGYSSFQAAAADSIYKFQVFQSGTNTLLATLDSVRVRSGGVYTIWLHGLKAGTGATALSTGVIKNAQF